MSEENVEKVRQGMEAYNRGDHDAALKNMAPDVVWEMPPFGATTTGQAHHGHDGVRAFWSDLEEHFDYCRLEPSEFRAAGDTVINHVRMRLRGRGSGAEVEIQLHCVNWLDDGRVIRTSYFLNEQGALEAAGLSE